MKTWRILNVAVCALAAAFVVTGAAQDAAAEPVKLITGPDYAPFTDPNLPNGGLATETVSAVFAAAGADATTPEFQPWKRGYQAVIDGGFDATFPYVTSEERMAEVVFSDSMFDLDTVAIFVAGSPHDYTGPDSVKGLTMCNPIGYAINVAVESAAKSGDLKVSENKDVAGCMKQILAGRVDFYLGGQSHIHDEMKKLGLTADKFKFGSTPVSRTTLHLIVGKNNPRADEIIKTFNDGLAKVKADGTWQAIFDRHMGG